MYLRSSEKIDNVNFLRNIQVLQQQSGWDQAVLSQQAISDNREPVITPDRQYKAFLDRCAVYVAVYHALFGLQLPIRRVPNTRLMQRERVYNIYVSNTTILFLLETVSGYVERNTRSIKPRFCSC